MTNSIDATENMIVDLALQNNPFVIALMLSQSYPTAVISCSTDGVIQISKAIANKTETTGWNQVANDPSTNAVMIATALTSAEDWMKIFPNLMSKLQKEWKKRGKSPQ